MVPVENNRELPIFIDPIDDLQNDPCFNKSSDDTVKMFNEKIPDFNPHGADQKYVCCVDWVSHDCLIASSKIHCTSTEAATLNALADKVIALLEAGECKANKYIKDLPTCYR
ncbi:unnamed protein product [Medioppia subpectinata]|uniref:Uncharacterized protein n=1 Tax=Medioppia subpectinata TaxID=1979941 RepID=A0A7R9KJP6_9ACAR|nr:unnamed protein product [Medioppia subpectinata]CAG2103616.1 unnamed protein product [Medioppia subpectinata]